MCVLKMAPSATCAQWDRCIVLIKKRALKPALVKRVFSEVTIFPSFLQFNLFSCLYLVGKVCRKKYKIKKNVLKKLGKKEVHDRLIP